MSPQNFGDQMKRLKSWFKAKLDPEQDRLIFERISFIPDEAWVDICQQIMDQNRPGSYFPAPREFIALWNDWARVNPEKIKLPDRTPCRYCDGTGRIPVEYVPKWIRQNAHAAGQALNLEDLAIWYEADQPCAGCDNWKLEFPPKGSDKPPFRVLPHTVGGEYIRLAPPKRTYQRVITRNLEELADQATQRIPQLEEGEG